MKIILNLFLMILTTNSTVCWAETSGKSESSLNSTPIDLSVVEYDGKILNHSKNIEDIACSEQVLCKIYKLNSFRSKEFNELHQSLNRNPKGVVNFSFTLQYGTRPNSGVNVPLDVFKELEREFEENNNKLTEEISNLQKLIDESPQKFFTIAAGNGIRISMLQSHGIALGQKNILYPAVFQNENSMVVAALADGKNYKIADYSNFGLTSVDVAAPVLSNKKGELLRGTSYATPYVAKMAVELQKLGDLSPKEIKEIILKSCDVPDIFQALAITQELELQKENSRVFKAMYSRKRSDREILRSQLGNVLLVRSGGSVNKDLALACGKHYLESNKKVSITDSCLLSHQVRGTKNFGGLKELWKARGI